MEAVPDVITLTHEEYAALLAKAKVAEPEPLPDPDELVAAGNEWDAKYKADQEELKQRKASNQECYRELIKDAFNRGLNAGDTNYLQHLVFHAYWNSAISCASLLHTLCRARGIDSKKIVSANRGRKCQECDNYTPLTSKTDLHWTTNRLCKPCTEKAEQKRASEAREQIQARANEIELLRTMPYAEYLKTDHWQRLRKGMLRQAGYRCQVCNASAPLQVHHRTYERRGSERWADLIALCGKCHETFHTEGELHH